MSDVREPPVELELAELIQSASEVDDPTVYRILDVMIAKQRRERERASEIVKLLDPPPAA